MCGIAGFFGNIGASGSETDVLRQMVRLLERRGPDDEGVWTDPEAGIALGQRRLAIVDLSPAGHQPMFSACGRFSFVFNGEIYNHEKIRSELDAEKTHPWRGHSDTEVLLEAIARWGVARALSRSVGMFALALWDRQERTLTLARDRLGEKPLYYGSIGKSIAFASELKAFRAHPNWKPEVDVDAVAVLMRHGYVPAPYSIYKKIHKVKPGQFAVFTDPMVAPRVETYWSAKQAAENGFSHPFQGDRNDAVVSLEGLLREAIKGQMMADVPIGAFLSGGIDSATVVALMQSMSSRRVQTFTIGFHEAGYNEAEQAGAIARHLGTDHTELYVSERDALEVIPKLPEVYCEPFSDSSQIPTYLVSRLARRKVTVSLSGDGGDELFSGYDRYGLADIFWNKLARIPRPLRRAAARLATTQSPQLYDRLAGPILQFLPKTRRYQNIGDKIHKAASVVGLRTADEVYQYLCSQWRDPLSIVRGAQEPPTMLTGLEALPPRSSNVERMMYIDLLSYLPDDVLVKVDRAAMAVSLETRVPMLDHRVVEFALSLPIAIHRSDRISKWPLRQVLYKHVPAHLVDRPKMGFGVPIDSWLRGPLRDWAEDLLSTAKLGSGPFDPAPIRSAWQEHLSGRVNNQYLLWNVLMFQSWQDAQKVQRPALVA